MDRVIIYGRARASAVMMAAIFFAFVFTLSTSPLTFQVLHVTTCNNNLLHVLLTSLLKL